MSAPSVWVEFFGPSTWKALHSIAHNYAADPANPTSEERRDVIDFLRLLEKLLPCPSCRVHYGKWLQSHPIDASTRESLVRWLYDLHSDVNRRSHKPNISYEEHKRDYSGWTQQDLDRLRTLPREKQLVTLADPHNGRRPFVRDGEHSVGESLGLSPTATTAIAAGVIGALVGAAAVVRIQRLRAHSNGETK